VEKNQLGLEPPIFKNIKIQVPNGNDYTLEKIKKDMGEFIKERLDHYRGRRSEDEKVFYDGITAYELSLGLFNVKEFKEIALHKEYVDLLIKTQGFNVDPSIYTYCAKFELEKVYPFLLTKDKQLANEWKNIRSTIKYVTLKVRGECLGKIVGGARIKCHVDMVKHIDFETICESTTKKTVVFTSFVEVLEKCIDVLKERKLIGTYVYAKTNSELPSITKAFKDDSRVNPLVATYKSLSTAVPLTMADTMILIDSPFRDYILQQAVSRIHRLDADTQTYVYVCELDTGEKPNISQRSKEILEWSQSQIEQIIGIKSPFEIKDMEQIDSYVPAMEDYSLNDKPFFLEWK
jgi:SNF2 family DNA or RNA helicase